MSSNEIKQVYLIRNDNKLCIVSWCVNRFTRFKGSPLPSYGSLKFNGYAYLIGTKRSTLNKLLSYNEQMNELYSIKK